MTPGKFHTLHLILATAVLASFAPGSAWATSGGLPTPLTPGMPWTDSKANRPCGMGCLYEKANENISLQALYTLKKIEFLKTATDDQILNNLADYCLTSEPGATGGKSNAKACFERYQRTEILVLIKMRAALVQNSDQASKLRGGVSTNIPPEIVMNEGDTGLQKPQVPYVPTYEDLQAEYKRMRKLTSNEYQNWAKNFPTEPSREDFVMFRDIPRDADKPLGEKITVVDSNPDGTPKYDMKAYEAAHVVYAEKKALMAEELKGMLAQKLPAPAPEMNDSVVAPESKDVFIQARGSMIDTTNAAILAANPGTPQQTAVPREVTFPGPAARGPANQVPGAAPGLPKYTGKEMVQAVKPAVDGRDVFVTVTPDDLTGAILEAMKP